MQTREPQPPAGSTGFNFIDIELIKINISAQFVTYKINKSLHTILTIGYIIYFENKYLLELQL